MSATQSGKLNKVIRWGVALALVAAAAATHKQWLPKLKALAKSSGSAEAEAEHADHDDHSGHEDHAGHDEAAEASVLELSEAARRNLGLTAEFLKPVELTKYRRTVTIPAVVVDKPGRTQVEVSTPLTGVITHVHAVTGEAVTPGTLLFELRITHEQLITAQTEFLKSLGELEVEKLEIKRLEDAAESGAISGRTLLERKYSRDKLEALIRAQREALRLQGLSDRQVEEIATDKKLLRSLQIVAPTIDDHSHDEELRLSHASTQTVSLTRVPDEKNGEKHDDKHAEKDHEHADDENGGHDDSTMSLIVERLSVKKGQTVNAGELLCEVADFSSLYIEGKAFDQDAPAINATASNNWPVTAIFPVAQGQETLNDLNLAFVGTEVDSNSRSLPFYVNLPNTITGTSKNNEGQRFVSWKYRPGQRLQLQVPVEEWPSELVVPVDAVVREAADWFVFRQNGKHFERVAVHVKFRDQSNAVIANDGAVFPGDVLALRSAHQMQMALKNKSGAGADPHAGHTH
ncbi:MAG: efflux RND transporter periplasmic adaptor subunit [Planctomycetaceae bacterium]|nr:efflux RND transporter periplasmic adaptor subunit [Planctomycetaceae bacterium]